MSRARCQRVIESPKVIVAQLILAQRLRCIVAYMVGKVAVVAETSKDSF